nr:FAD-dependent oxidoreductase [Rhodococcus sp. (in: high G+C Gram-positive bacteria)]
MAIVGSGAAGSYALLELLRYPNVRVTVFERLPTPWGLVRAGVAPDHQDTKAVTAIFEQSADHGHVQFVMNVEVGKDLFHADLARHHHAVIYASGASSDRRLNIPGEHLSGNVAASEFVQWYNGHPDAATQAFDFSTTRAVIVGNGNVALDIGRLLVSEPDSLARTDMADYAVAALRQSSIKEVVILGRRGPREAAFSGPELLALSQVDGVDVIADLPDGTPLDQHSDDIAPLKIQLMNELATHSSSSDSNRRVILRFDTSPLEMVGEGRVTGLRVSHTRCNSTGPYSTPPFAKDGTYVIETGMVLRSIGYHGRAIDGIPFDPERGVVPNTNGRVTHNGTVVGGVYTTGWIKRGARGVIGTNRECAKDTVASLMSDHRNHVLAEPTGDGETLESMLLVRVPGATNLKGWRSIDHIERTTGHLVGAPRKKITDRAALLAAARGEAWPGPEA